MSVDIDMESFSKKKNLRRRTLNTLKSAMTALKQLASKFNMAKVKSIQIKWIGRVWQS